MQGAGREQHQAQHNLAPCQPRARPGSWLAGGEIVLCLVLFTACTLHVRLRQRNARAQAQAQATADTATAVAP